MDMNALFTLSEALAGIVDSTGAGVVGVEAGRRSRGTGVAWSPEGLVVTADHVVHREEGIRVRLADGQEIPAAMVGRDPTTDIAVLRVSGTAVKALPWGEPSALKVGNLVLALGRPGRTLRATMGIVSVLGDEWQTPAGGRIDRYLEADVNLYPGFSGGPLIDVSGNLLGINTAGLRRGGSLTVVTPTIRRVVEGLATHGRIRHGYLGIATQPVRLAPALAERAQQQRGLLVMDVEPGSPAEQGGLLLGDTLLQIAGQAVRYPEELFGLLGGERIGTLVSVRVLRAGAPQDLSVTVGERLRKSA
jgi:S1-C subfamily serine protease